MQFSDGQLQLSDRGGYGWTVVKSLIFLLNCLKIGDFQPQILRKFSDEKKLCGRWSAALEQSASRTASARHRTGRISLATKNVFVQLRHGQILPSIDIWHLFELISWISRLLCSFFFTFEFFSSFSYHYFLHFLVLLSQASYLSHNRVFLDFFIIYFFSVPCKTFKVFFQFMC